MDGNRFTNTYPSSRGTPLKLEGVGPEGPTGPAGVTDCTHIIKAVGAVEVGEGGYADVSCASFAASDVVAFLVLVASSQSPIPPHVVEPRYGEGFKVKFGPGDAGAYAWMVISSTLDTE